jgi:hypothetical protein
MCTDIMLFQNPPYMASRQLLIPRIATVGTSFSPLPCQAWHGYGVTSAHRVEVEVAARRACERTRLRGRRRCAAGGRLLVPIIRGSVVSDTDTPTIERTTQINLTGWEFPAVSSPTSVSPPTYAGGVPSRTSDGLDKEGDSSDDEGDRFLPDDTVEDS